MARSAKKWAVLVVQLAVSVGLMLYVCRQIQLDDQVALANGEKVVGRLEGGASRDPLALRLPSGELRQIALREVLHASDGHLIGLQQGFRTVLARVEPGPLALGFVALILGYFVSVIRWWILLRWQGIDVRLGQAFRWTYIGIFFNNVMLGSTGGDVIKALYVARECHDRTRAVVSVFVDRAIGMLSLALLAGIVTTPFAAQPEFREAATVTYGVLFAAVAGSMVYFSRRVRRVFHVDWILSKLPLQGKLREIDQAVLIYRAHLGAVGVGVLLSLAGHSFLVLSTAYFGRALGLDLPSSTYFIFVPVILILTALPVTVQGWGLAETIFQHGFSKVGVADEVSLALALINRLAVMVFSLGGGVLMLLGSRVPQPAEGEDAEDALIGSPDAAPAGEPPSASAAAP